MKINRVGGAGFFPQNLRVNKNHAGVQSQNAKTGDELSLSQDALNFSKVLSEARSAISPAAVQSPEQQARISQLRDAISAGDYHVDSEAVAENIIKTIYG